MLLNTEAYTKKQVIDFIHSATKGNESFDCSLSELQFSSKDDVLIVEFPDGRKMPACDNAVRSLCKEASIPYSYFEKISDGLKVENMSKRLNGVPRERRIELNSRLNIVRGLVPTSYSNFGNEDAIDCLPEDLNTLLVPMQTFNNELDYLTMKDVSWRVLFGGVKPKKDTSKCFTAITLRTSELGGKFETYPTLFRQVCSNGVGIYNQSKKSAYSMAYSAVETAVAQGLLLTLYEVWAGKMDEIQKRVQILEDQMLSAEQVGEIFKELETAKVSKKFINELMVEVPGTELPYWDLVNIITNKAKELPEIGRIKTESVIGEISGLSSVFSGS